MKKEYLRKKTKKIDVIAEVVFGNWEYHMIQDRYADAENLVSSFSKCFLYNKRSSLADVYDDEEDEVEIDIDDLGGE